MNLLKRNFGKTATAHAFTILHTHFAGGERFEDLTPTLDRLQRSGIGAILDYAAEGKSCLENILCLLPIIISLYIYIYRCYFIFFLLLPFLLSLFLSSTIALSNLLTLFYVPSPSRCSILFFPLFPIINHHKAILHTILYSYVLFLTVLSRQRMLIPMQAQLRPATLRRKSIALALRHCTLSSHHVIW